MRSDFQSNLGDLFAGHGELKAAYLAVATRMLRRAIASSPTKSMTPAELAEREPFLVGMSRPEVLDAVLAGGGFATMEIGDEIVIFERKTFVRHAPAPAVRDRPPQAQTQARARASGARTRWGSAFAEHCAAVRPDGVAASLAGIGSGSPARLVSLIGPGMPTLDLVVAAAVVELGEIDRSSGGVVTLLANALAATVPPEGCTVTHARQATRGASWAPRDLAAVVAAGFGSPAVAISAARGDVVLGSIMLTPRAEGDPMVSEWAAGAVARPAPPTFDPAPRRTRRPRAPAPAEGTAAPDGGRDLSARLREALEPRLGALGAIRLAGIASRAVRLREAGVRRTWMAR